MRSLVGSAFGRYEIRRMLGQGGMGEVYEAYDTEKGRTVALKLLTDRYAQDETYRARFLRESHAAAILQEPHVIPIHDWGEVNGVLYIDMRLIRGETLHEMLKSGPLEPERAADIIRQIAAALDAAHAEGLIHRDVKPQNIIVTSDDFAYLVDFGIAEAKGDTHLTMSGYQVGTFDYMAPERLGDGEVTASVDVYSLACVLYEALTGAKPFPMHSAEQVIGAHISSPPPRPSIVNPRVPTAFDEVIARGMAKHPDDRYSSAGALGRAAKRALQGESSTPPQPDTVLAPQYVSGPPSYPPFNALYAYPGTAPTPVVNGDQGRSKQFIVGISIGIAVALVGGVGVVIGLLAHQDSNGSEPSAAPLVPYSNPIFTTSPTESSSTSPSTQAHTTVTSAPQDPTQELRQIAADDRPWVSAQLTDRWVPQLSSKRPGVVDNGQVWDNAMTLQEHLQLRQRFSNVRLLWSGDWSTFSAPDFWVTIAGITFPDSAGALAWCGNQGFDRDHCAAKIVSTTHPVAGSTAYN
ncbi:serine/threonine protein kinase [Mycobacterium sp. E1715]|uniref:serine/threonine-protein kinase n=1 Tax=unclassified Mycobacterium TaxID=2642494 RepID=UPI0007FC1469|nr:MULTISPECIES: serine/threonine-protein kinase [unclassified Mycobacterium]OBG66452.1 serine/threonine protein kinase [Mycobacterium sp. E188]OBH10969.1 serine/threonine protein kinase [Mycobacterium sp. E1715]OBH36530.1 serine/threonine protein kinase [Mycobacterium sp. E183]